MANNNTKDNWHSLNIEKVYEILSSSEKGLTTTESENRVREYGYNKLPEQEGISALKLFFSQFRSPLTLILFVAGSISLIFSNYVDAIVIFSAVIIDVVLGFYQENKANKSLKFLQGLIQYHARVFRDGKEKEINSRDLVPGDIIQLNSGDRVPADARLIEATDFDVIEAPLTGESVPSSKKVGILSKDKPLADRENMIFSGTTVAKGVAKAIVCETGNQTEIGKIAVLIKETEEGDTPFQAQVKKFSKNLAVVLLGLIALFVILGVIQGRSLYSQDGHGDDGILNLAVATSVSAIPEGLLIMITASLAAGMRVILKRKALVRRLVAAETLGSTSVICVDKTGTLTQGIMNVDSIITSDRDRQVNAKSDGATPITETEKEILEATALCSDVLIDEGQENEEYSLKGDPTETAMVITAQKYGIDKLKLDKKRSRLGVIPFTSENKYMATVNYVSEEENQINLKGAPEIVLDFCTQYKLNDETIKFDQKKKQYFERKYNRYVGQGFRLLAVATKSLKNDVDKKKCTEKFIGGKLCDMTFLGFIALRDPIRPEVKQAFKLTKQAGIKTVIVTGDHKLTAKAIAEETFGRIVKDSAIKEGVDVDKMSEQELQDNIDDIVIFARVEPKHKLRIVKAWQKKGKSVAMSGDGINDAPALKAADIGIALGSSTDIAKQTADLVLLDDNFKTIVSAVKEGRVIFDNIRKIVLYLLSDSFSEIILITGAILLGFPIPLLPAQILWINLITDGFPDLALIFEPSEKDVMSLKPRAKSASILDKEMKTLIFIIGVVTDLLLLGIYWYLLKFSDLELINIRTFIFAVLGVDSLFYVFSCKSLRQPLTKINIFNNKYLIFAVLLGFGMQLVAIYEPHMQKLLGTQGLNLIEWVLIIVLGIIEIVLIEVTKYYFIIKRNKRH